MQQRTHLLQAPFVAMVMAFANAGDFEASIILNT